MRRSLHGIALLLAASWGAAACDGHLSNASSEVDASFDATSPPIDASASPAPTLEDAGDGDAAVVQLGIDSGSGVDAGTSDPADASCALDLVTDAAPQACEVAPADVTCDAGSDCTILIVNQCCDDAVHGVNQGSHAVCSTPPCLPPPGGCPNPGFITDDCSIVPSLSHVQAVCLNHRCQTVGVSPP